MWLDKIIAIWSPMMKSTIELGELNKLWERFNNGENVLIELECKEWKYHQDKIKLLKDFHLLQEFIHKNEITKRMGNTTTLGQR